MRLSKSTIACMMALPALCATQSVMAGVAVESFEFGGYIRQGFLLSAENDFKDAGFIGQKETLGRLGLEADNQTNIDLSTVWRFDNGNMLRVGAGLESGRTANGGSGFVEFDGILPSGVLFAGKRDYGKERYIFMTDFFYTDMSGTGIGVENYELGDGTLNAAFMVSERTYDDVEDPSVAFPDANLNNYMHAFNVAYKYDAWDISATFKTMPDNWDVNGNEFAETGYDLTVSYTFDSFFGVNSFAEGGNGQSYTHIIAQGGVGLGSGNLLGGTITSYNAYSPGSLLQGEHEFEWGAGNDAISLLTLVEDEDKSSRLLIWGGHSFDNGIGIFPSIQGQYNWHEDTSDEYWVSAMMRMTKGINNYMYIQGEAGYVYNRYVDSDSGWEQSKITIAPTFIMPTGTGVVPEIRLLASYVTDAWSTDAEKGQSDNDFILGMQAEIFW